MVKIVSCNYQAFIYANLEYINAMDKQYITKAYTLLNP